MKKKIAAAISLYGKVFNFIRLRDVWDFSFAIIINSIIIIL